MKAPVDIRNIRFDASETMTSSTKTQIEPLIDHCSRLKQRDFQRHHQIYQDQIEQIIENLENRRQLGSNCSPALLKILHTFSSSLSKFSIKNSSAIKQRSAQLICRLFISLCHLDPTAGSSQEGKAIVEIVLQWLRDTPDFQLENQTLFVLIYSVIEKYSVVCPMPEEFLDDLFRSVPMRKSSSARHFHFHSCRRTKTVESMSIVDFSIRLITNLLETSDLKFSPLIHQILNVILIYIRYPKLINFLLFQSDFYRSTVVDLLAPTQTDYFVQCVIDETARSQTDSTENSFVFISLIRVLGELGLNCDFDLSSDLFVPTFDQLLNALIECGTTVPLWYFLQTVTNLLTRSTDETRRLVKEMDRHNFTRSLMIFTIDLIEKSSLAQGRLLLKDLHQNVLTCSMAIFYNLCQFDASIFDREKIQTKICRFLLRSENSQVRLLSCLLYCELTSLTEIETDHLYLPLCEQLVESIRQAFATADYHFSQQISLFTLLNALRKLSNDQQFRQRFSQSDENFQLLFDILRRFHRLSDRDDEIRVLLETIWFLSFDWKSARTIHQQDKFFALLVEIGERNQSEGAQHTARGILWQLKQTIATDENKTKMNDQSKHIMISYSHESKEMVHQIYDYLRQVGYSIWLDVDHMHGSTLESMAKAVEQSSMIIVCLSEKYKQSPNCQSEAEYAYRLKKPLVPILLQSKYKPNGWLGILIGTRLYIDFTKRDFQSNVKKLVEEIEIVQSEQLLLTEIRSN